jgi:antirestriction protein ArdC
VYASSEAQTDARLSAGVAPKQKTQKRFVTHRADTRALPPSPCSVKPCCRFAVFVPASRLCEEQKQPNPADRGLKMLLTGKSKPKSIQELTQASLDVLVKDLESGHSEMLSAYLQAMAKFHYYSFGNILLIAAQRPTASQVAGLRAWNDLGRRVKRGEKGIMILAPLIRTKRREADSQARQVPDTDNSQTETQLLGFRAVYVFDVEQTEGPEIPKLGNTVKGDVGDRLERLVEFTHTQGIKLEYSERIAPAQGLSYGGMIRLLPDLQPAETLSVLVHELAHEMLHKAERRTLITKTVRETEAEAVAFVVCHALGLETGTGSADYIQLYHGDAKLLAESLEVVQHAAAVILGALSPRDEVNSHADGARNEARSDEVGQ